MKQTPVTCEQLSAWSLRYNQSAERRLATLALSKTALNDVAFVSRASFEMKQKFSLEIPTLDVTNQQASGRCWLFAATNVLREMARQGACEEAIQSEKQSMLADVYAFLCSCYTEPPKAFDFEYVDKDKAYHLEKGLTPLTFRDKYVGDLLKKTVSIIHAPTADKPYHQTYTVRLLGNVVGGKPVKHLNLTMDEFKAAIIAQMQAGKVVWFGSDVGKFGERERGVWDDQCFDMELLTGLNLTISKADALDYGFSAMNHAMVLTGVQLEDGKPTRWKIENSWGDKNGSKGYYVCSDSWFDQYVYQAAVEKEYLGDLAALSEKEPVVLAPWDPMGTLAD